jgi:hypothetical protein
MIFSSRDAETQAQLESTVPGARVRKWIMPLAIIVLISCSTLSILETPFMLGPTTVDAAARRHQFEIRSRICFIGFLLTGAVATLLLHRARQNGELDLATRFVTSALLVLGGVALEIFLLVVFLRHLQPR